MDRHIDLRDARVLVALTAALLAGGLLALVSCAQQGSGTHVSAASDAAQVTAKEEAAVPTSTEGGAGDAGASAGEGGLEPGGNGADAAGGTSEPGTSPEAEARTESEPDLDPGHKSASIEPAGLSAGDELSTQDVERAGGASSFFYAEPISDEVFARMEGKSFGADCTVPREELRYLRLLHVDAEGRTMVGELVVHRNVADEVLDIFSQLYQAGYPIRKMRLVDDYDADDNASCADDNTSSFNYRVIAGTSTISNHAYGLAIDINPFENPYCVWSMGVVSPEGSSRFVERSLHEPYMIHADDLCYQLFISHGWSWGGAWAGDVTDYQHFEKPDALWQ